MTGPESFRGTCTPCDWSFVGVEGAKAMRAHRKAVHPCDAWGGPERVPRWVHVKAVPWVAPKPLRTIEETLAKWADYGVEVLAS